MCDNCGEEVGSSTIKKRDCLKKSCDKIVKPGTPLKSIDRTLPSLTHSCHFPLVISTEEDKLKKASEERMMRKEQKKNNRMK